MTYDEAIKAAADQITLTAETKAKLAGLLAPTHQHGCSAGTPSTGCRPASRCRNHRGEPQRVGQILIDSAP